MLCEEWELVNKYNRNPILSQIDHALISWFFLFILCQPG